MRLNLDEISRGPTIFDLRVNRGSIVSSTRTVFDQYVSVRQYHRPMIPLRPRSRGDGVVFSVFLVFPEMKLRKVRWSDYGANADDGCARVGS